MQIQGDTELATSPYPCECDGAKLPVNNFETHEGKKWLLVSHQRGYLS